jgi:alpha-tubulin suppressor-like RCC1 family protein
MTRIAAGSSILLAVLLACTTACSDGTGPRKLVTPVGTLAGLVVSQPVGGPAGARGSVRAFASVVTGGSVVYVSLVPGSVPTGVLATIRDQASGLSVTTPVVDGGFDPVALAASVGDSLLLHITRTGSAAPVEAMEVVRARRPPVVVRTSPPSGGRDVPLNAVMVLVFSDPIDPATLTTGSVQLWRDTASVAGTVRFSDSVGIRAEFHPDSLLAGQTTYRLVVTPAVHDVDGAALDSAVGVPFTTGTTAPASALVFASVSAGDMHTCGVTTGGAVYCWGDNRHGQLGNGTTASSLTPVAVAGGLTFKSVSASRYGHTCGVTTDGAAYCWGLNMAGQLGYGSTPPPGCSLDPNWGEISCSAPVAVAGGLAFVSVSAGEQYSCGVTASGAAYCWGSSGAPLGVEPTQVAGCGPDTRGIDACPPVPVSGGLSFATVDGDVGHGCGVTTDHRAFCWGDDQYGALGDSRKTASLVPCCAGGSVAPVAVAGGLSFATLSAKAGRTCGVTTGQAAYCWGYGGSLGALGTTVGLQECESDAADMGFDGWSPCSFVPLAVTGGLTFATVSVGFGTSCGLTTTGAAYCWGGNDTTASSAAPVAVAGGLTFATLSAGDATCGVTTSGVAYCWGGNSYGTLGNGTTTGSTVPVKVAGQR